MDPNSANASRRQMSKILAGMMLALGMAATAHSRAQDQPQQMPQVLKTSRPLMVSASAPKQPSAPVTGAQVEKHARKATLPELYAMFFTYAVHVQALSDADERRGLDRAFYRHHLQRNSGLTAEEYGRVLDAAVRYIAVVTRVNKQISDLDNALTSGDPQMQSAPTPLPEGYVAQTKALVAEGTSSLSEEIASLRLRLGRERADAFELYLQKDYAVGKIAPEQESGTSSATAHGRSEALPADITFDGGQTCYDFTDNYGLASDVCTDSQMSYVGPENQVELWSSASGYTTNPYTWLVKGNLDVNNQASSITCSYSGIGGATDAGCSAIAQFNSGAGVSYTWTTTATINLAGGGSADHVDPNPPSVTIYYPDLGSLSQSNFGQGTSGQFEIYSVGHGLSSPFQNPPTVIDAAVNFSSLNVVADNRSAQEFITVTYTVSDLATPGLDKTLIVNNGFGLATWTPGITIVGSPTINGSDGNPITSSSSSPIQVLAGQSIALSVAAPPDQTIQSQSWTFANPGDAVAGFNASDGTVTPAIGGLVPVTETTGSSFAWYFIVPGATETITASVTYSNGATASTTEWYSVDGPTGISASDSFPVAPVQILSAPPEIALGNGSQDASAGPNYGILVQASASHIPSSQNVGSNSRFQWVSIITNLGLNPRESGVAQPTICQSSVPLPALDTIYPASVGLNFDDAPAYPLPTNYGELEGSDAFRSYLMWDPALPSGCQPNSSFPGNPPCTSIPIPLGSFTWSWSGDAINSLSNQTNGTTFSQQCGSETGDAASFVPASSFPQWGEGSVVGSGSPLPKAFACTPPLQ